MSDASDPWRATNSGFEAALDTAQWFTSCEILANDGGSTQARTGDEEGCLVVLSGCHDLYAGGGSWIERGVRDAPENGRPVVVFLPPNTPFKVENGRGEVLRLGARRPPEPTGAASEDTPKKKPLLAMAGSGKAFDSESGTWTPQEQMPDSPEALLPRRIERVEGAGWVREHILPLEYKARGLVVEEIALAPGGTATLEPDSALEHLVLVRSAEGTTLHGLDAAVGGAGGLWVGTAPPASVTAEGGPAWIVHARVLPKPTRAG